MQILLSVLGGGLIGFVRFDDRKPILSGLFCLVAAVLWAMLVTLLVKD